MKTLKTISDIEAEIKKKEKELNGLKLRLSEEKQKEKNKKNPQLVGKCFKKNYNEKPNHPADYLKVLDYLKDTDEFKVLFIDDYSKKQPWESTIYILNVDVDCIEGKKCSLKEFNEALQGCINYLSSLTA